MDGSIERRTGLVRLEREVDSWCCKNVDKVVLGASTEATGESEMNRV